MDRSAALLQKLASGYADGAGSRFYISLLAQPLAWLSVALRPLQFLVWTRILARVDLGLAYPLTTLSYPVTMIAAGLLFHEPPF
jgi:hypothetical protein